MIKAIQILNDDSETLSDDDTRDDINDENVMEKLECSALASIVRIRQQQAR